MRKIILMLMAMSLSVGAWARQEGNSQGLVDDVERRYRDAVEFSKKAEDAYSFASSERNAICNKVKRGEYEKVPLETYKDVGLGEDFIEKNTKPAILTKTGFNYRYYPETRGIYFSGKSFMKVDYDNDGEMDILERSFQSTTNGRYLGNFITLTKYDPIEKNFWRILVKNGGLGDYMEWLAPFYVRNSPMKSAPLETCNTLNQEKYKEIYRSKTDCFYTVKTVTAYNGYDITNHNMWPIVGQRYIKIDGIYYLTTILNDEEIFTNETIKNIRYSIEDEDVEKNQIVRVDLIRHIDGQDANYLMCELDGAGIILK